MSLPETFAHPAMQTGKLVQVLEGSAPVWSGLLNQPSVDEDGWSFGAIGFYDEMYSAYLCFDSGMNTTATPDVAIDQAIARGLPCTRPVSISNVAFGGGNNTASLNYVGDLLDVYETSVSKHWRISPSRAITLESDPTSPTWYMSPGSGRIGLADDSYASNLYLRYQSGAASFATVAVADNTAAAKRRREYPVDATKLGLVGSTVVTNIGNGMIARGKARYAWTNPVTPGRMQLTTPGGQPAYLPFVKAGDMVRTFGVVNEYGTTIPYVDWIIGRAEYEEGSNVIQLAPRDLAARDLADILALAVA